MNDRKFLFVTCVNDEQLYARCVKHIQQLDVPSGYAVELLPVRGAVSMCQGYNHALWKDAKYKIFLHQDTFILHKQFLHDILQLFIANPLLGMLGMVGCKVLPSHGSWFGGSDLVGKFISCENGVHSLELWREPDGPFEAVEGVDGFMIVTQYDVTWRADLFRRFHFYDASQAAEFLRRGLIVGIPRQAEPWCLHFYENHNINWHDYTKEQKVFLTHYKGRDE
ncbi:glycosyltransferase family protein [Numidum massiliense]|uniref:glycosyltransferase family protein n=1 Tax=Numidum massiliense TaxID=1522315 RepID=UPI0006D57C41|nr:glycosyltransferase family protein [Numidum massiliense]